MFEDVSASDNTMNESFVLGVSGDGDRTNNTTGNLSGNLIAGHDYEFYFNIWIAADDNTGPPSLVGLPPVQ
jgi:hypothetical protein